MFVGEVVVVIVVLAVHRMMKRAPKPEHPPTLDYGGAALSAVALGLIVFGILKSSTWGWIRPVAAPTISGHKITPLGFSVVPFLIMGGLIVLGCFFAWEERRERGGRSTLLNRALLKIETLRGGLTSLAAQQLIVMGTFFVLPVYLQVVLGFDAFETGKRLFPMSISMLAAALAGPKVAARRGPRTVVQVGLGAMAIAALVLVGTIDVTLNGTAFALSLVFFGIGAGLLMSQLGNVIMSSAPPDQTNEAGGLQGTAQNLGASLGTALIGSVLLLGLLNGFNTRIQQNPAVPPDVKTQISKATETGIPIVTTDEGYPECGEVFVRAGRAARQRRDCRKRATRRGGDQRCQPPVSSRSHASSKPRDRDGVNRVSWAGRGCNNPAYSRHHGQDRTIRLGAPSSTPRRLGRACCNRSLLGCRIGWWRPQPRRISL